MLILFRGFPWMSISMRLYTMDGGAKEHVGGEQLRVGAGVEKCSSHRALQRRAKGLLPGNRQRSSRNAAAAHGGSIACSAGVMHIGPIHNMMNITYMHTHIHIYIYIRTYTHIYTYTHIHIYTFTPIHIYTYNV